MYLVLVSIYQDESITTYIIIIITQQEKKSALIYIVSGGIETSVTKSQNNPLCLQCINLYRLCITLTILKIPVEYSRCYLL